MKTDKLVDKMQRNPAGIKFTALCKVCDEYFGEYRQKGSHRIYQTKHGIINIQNHKGMAIEYQVQQVLRAILGG